jgi:hypothetical protein
MTVKPLPELFGDSFESTAPPVCCGAMVIRPTSEKSETKLVEQRHVIRAQQGHTKTSSRVWHTPLYHMIHSLTSNIKGKAEKKLASCNGAQFFPNSLPWRKSGCSMEIGIVAD